MQVSRIIVRGIALLGLALTVALGSLAVAPSFAGAQTDGYDGYDGYEGEDDGYDGYDGYEGEDPDTGGEELTAPPTSGTGGGTLPLTGGTTMLAAAVVLGGLGVALRRFAATS